MSWSKGIEKKDMATHSSVLAWRIPRTKEPSRLRSMGSQSQTQVSDYHSFTHSEVLKPYRVCSLITVKLHGIFKGFNILKISYRKKMLPVCSEIRAPGAVLSLWGR